MDNTTSSKGLGARTLDLIEWIGNKLPDPVFLFIGAAVIILVLSGIGSSLGWSVERVRPTVITQAVVDAAGAPVLDADGQPTFKATLDEAGKPLVELRPELNAEGQPVRVQVQSLLTSDGAFWALRTMVTNFTGFAPLGLILVCMFGIGVAEKVGLFGAILKWLGTVVPMTLLTPAVVFLGILSNVASDAGYLVLPPLAAALYLAAGRSPLAGVAASFAGIAAGFSANLLVSAGDALIAGITETGAQVLDPSYQVNPTCNWYFLAASTFVLTLLGWAITAWIIEPRLTLLKADEGGPQPISEKELRQQEISPGERRALFAAIVAEVIALGLVLAMILIPGAPLHGPLVADNPDSAARWTSAVVPMIFLLFLAPGLAYGISTGEIRSHRDITKCFVHAMASMAPVITMYFFAAQFVAYLNYSNIGQIIAFKGGLALVNAGLSPSLLLIGVVVLTLFTNLFVGSMSAKWTMLAPILAPMLMMVGISPELAQASYRVGDSATNIITPLNPYMIIILAVMQRYAPKAGMGSLIALMTPYSLLFAVVWTLFLLLWAAMDIPLGPGGPLTYIPKQ